MEFILKDDTYYDTAEKKYYFYLTDHLGNNRVVADQSGAIIQRNHYYPFGMTFAESTDPDTQPYNYNGKELDRKLGLNLYDYSARQMNNAVPRFTSVDALAERYLSISPYAYVEKTHLSTLIRQEYAVILFFILQ